jgi:hypothetical protein
MGGAIPRGLKTVTFSLVIILTSPNLILYLTTNGVNVRLSR